MQKYGFLLVLLYCFGCLTPALHPKVSMMEIDLNSTIGNKSGGNLFKQLFWISLFVFYGISTVVYKNKLLNKSHFTKAVLAFSLILSISLLSMIWSSFPSYVLKRTLFQLIFISACILSFYFSYNHNSLDKCIRLCIYTMFFLIFLSLLFGWGLTSDLSLAGYEKGKNVLGMDLVVIFIFYNLFNKNDPRNIKLTINTFLIALIVLTQSTTCLLLTIIFFTFSKFRQEHIKVINFIALLSLAGIFIVLPSVSYYANSYTHIGLYVEPEFITGRGYIWDTIYYDLSFFKNMFLGYGYASYFGTPEIPYLFDDSYSFLKFISSPHNGFISLLLQFGVLSIVVLLLFMLMGANVNGSSLNAALTVVIIHNITEDSFFRDNTVIWLLFIIVIACTLVNKRAVN